MIYGIIIGLSIMVSAILSGVEWIHPKWIAFLPIAVGIIYSLFFLFSKKSGKDCSGKDMQAPEPEKDAEETVLQESKPVQKTGGLGCVFSVFLLIAGVFCAYYFSLHYKVVKLNKMPAKIQSAAKPADERDKITPADRKFVKELITWQKANPGVELPQEHKDALEKARRLGMVK